MIARVSELSPSQNSAASPASGRGTVIKPNPQERLSAAMQMRNQLFLLDPSERRMSIEDYISLVLESQPPENHA